MVQWLDSESFLLDSTADIRQVYSFKKRNPSSAKFIYKKYKGLQPTIKELYDPDSPLYLDGVKKSLEGIVQIEDANEDLKSIQERIGFLVRERDKLQATVDEKVKEYKDFEAKLKAALIEEEQLSPQKANIRRDLALELIEKNLSDVEKFLKSLDDKWNERLRANPFEIGIRIEKDTLNLIPLLKRNITELENNLKTDDFLSPENLDEYHKELLEKAQKEKQSAMSEMKAYMIHNPKKVIGKTLDSLDIAMSKIKKAEVFGDVTYLTKIDKGLILGIMEESYGYLSNLKNQVENAERRKK